MKKPTKSTTTKKEANRITKSTTTKEEAKRITMEAIENVTVTVFEPKSDEDTFTGASLDIETEAGHIYIKGFARWSEKNDNWFFSGPSYKNKNEYVSEVFGDKAVFESINNAINAAMEEM